MSVSLSTALQNLYLRTAAGIKPGLKPTLHLLESLGNPQFNFPVIHVAGTNGKGSTCAMIESMLRASGLRTGLFTSPHLVHFNERIKVDGKNIDDASLASGIEEIEKLDQAQSITDRKLTFFEFSVVLALLLFTRCNVQVVIMETGLGGLWDATNVVNASVCVLTPIDLDHEKYLGCDMKKIAHEKAGIIKNNCFVVSAKQQEETFKIITEKARQENAKLINVSDGVGIQISKSSLKGQHVCLQTNEMDYGTFCFPLLGRHQLGNMALAVTAVEMFMEQIGLEISRKHLRKGLQDVQWPGRFQVYDTQPPIILDGAHNIHAAKALKKTLEDYFPGEKGFFICAGMKDKPFEEMLKIWKSVMSFCWAPPLDIPRALSCEKRLNFMQRIGINGDKVESLDMAIKRSRKRALETDSFVCVTGTFRLFETLL